MRDHRIRSFVLRDAGGGIRQLDAQLLEHQCTADDAGAGAEVAESGALAAVEPEAGGLVGEEGAPGDGRFDPETERMPQHTCGRKVGRAHTLSL